jgi:hypothetical protein
MRAVVSDATNAVENMDDALRPFKGWEKTCLLWIRRSDYQPERNLTNLAFTQLYSVLVDCGYKPIVIGPKSAFCEKSEENLIEFYKQPLFLDNPLNQLVFLDRLCDRTDVRFSIGMKSGGMDGLAFLRGLKTIYFGRKENNARMGKVNAAFPAFSFIPIQYRTKFTSFENEELEEIYRIIDV